jgi:hypothetical protein
MLVALFKVTSEVFVVRPMRSDELVEAMLKFERVCDAPKDALPTGDSITFAPDPPSVTLVVCELKAGLFNCRVTLKPELIVLFDPLNWLLEVAEPFNSTAPLVLETVFEPTVSRKNMMS